MQVGKIENLPGFLKETFAQWQKDKATRMGAALSYYTIFSLPPLLLIAITLAGYFFGQEAAEGRIVQEMQGLLGREGAEQVQSMIHNVQKSNAGVIATIIGIITLLLGASGVFGQIQDSLNSIWGVEPKPGRGWMSMLKERLGSFTMVIGTGFLLLVSLLIDTILTAFTDYLSTLFSSNLILYSLKAGHLVVSFLIVTLMFAMIYKVLPDVKLSMKDVGLGAVATAILFTIGKFLIGLYLGHSNIGAAYGAAGSVIVMLVWIFYASLIFLFGAEFTQVYVRKYGSEIVTKNDAIIVDPAKCNVRAEGEKKDPVLEKKQHDRSLEKQKKLALIPISASPRNNIGKQKNKVPKQQKSFVSIAFKVISGMVLARYRKPHSQKINIH